MFAMSSQNLDHFCAGTYFVMQLLPHDIRDPWLTQVNAHIIAIDI